MADNASTRAAAARGFVRSLNILLKFARMYDFGHPRTAKQYETAWSELKTAIGGEDEAGLLLAVSGDSLLLDGEQLDSAAAEKSFARMLSASGIASIHFSPKITQQSLAKFVRGFPTGSSTKPGQLAEQLKASLQGDPHIHVNEVCFVPADSAVAKTTVAAQLAARTLGMNSEETDKLLNDPEKLLQLIVAAEGKGGPGAGLGPGKGPGNGPGNGSGSGSGTGTSVGSGSGSGGYAGGGQPVAPGQDSGGANSDFYSGGGAGAGGSGSGAVVEGPVASVYGGGSAPSGGSGTWNVVGGNSGRGGTPIDPNAGGFWLSKDDGSSAAGSGTQPTIVSGPVAGVGSGAAGTVASGGTAGVLPGPGDVSGSSGSGTGAVGVTGGVVGAGASVTENGPGGASGGGVGRFPGRVESGGGPVSRWAHASSGIRTSRSARGGAGSMSVETGMMTLQEDELQGILQVLAQIARTNDTSKERIDPSAFQSRLSTLPRRARFTVSQALSALAAQAPSESADKPTLLKLAEHIAVRFALEKYERGDVQVNAVRQLLDEMNTELESLRKVLGVYEEKMAQAGIHVQSHVEMLAQEFWSQVPDEKKKVVMESTDAWCVPPVRMREYIEGLIARGETAGVEKILANYARCIQSKNPEARRQTALGLAELAPIYAKSDEKLFTDTIRVLGVQLADEKDSQLQSLLGAAFVRFSQEAAKLRSYPAVKKSVELLDYLDTERPGAGKSLRPRIAVENKLPDFIDEALKAGSVPAGLTDLLRRVPQPAAEQIAGRFGRVGFREDCELLVAMMESLGTEGLEHLRRQLREGRPSEAIDTVGILARIDVETLERVLPERMREWKRSAHDRVVRQLASSGAADRGRLLLQLFDGIDGMIRPLAVDEIGMAGEKTADMRLLRIAEGDLPSGSTEYLRLKAIEALGRLRTSGAEAILRKVAEARKTFRWANPSELRIVAAQAMEKIDPEWMRDFVPRCGLNVAEFSIELLDSDPTSSAIRQRRYPRLRLERPVPATTVNLKENCRVDIAEMGLGGGVAVCEQSLHPGNVVELRMAAAQKTIKAQTIVRDANTQARAFEVVDIDLEERSKLRKLLVQLGSVLKQSSSKERNRRAGRTILASNS
ncbi:MAG TPA: hypothetical protein VEJ38_02435 [Candidatus Acidoferrales bacterium]|nr:hypothetical protein [Candidatus Acidoferrales bacterium]